jgi:hypothetical protein
MTGNDPFLFNIKHDAGSNIYLSRLGIIINYHSCKNGTLQMITPLKIITEALLSLVSSDGKAFVGPIFQNGRCINAESQAEKRYSDFIGMSIVKSIGTKLIHCVR